jgi:hypothetical protein
VVWFVDMTGYLLLLWLNLVMKRRLEDSTLDLIFIRKERKFSISLTLSAQKSYLKFPAEEADNVVVSELADIRQCNRGRVLDHV